MLFFASFGGAIVPMLVDASSEENAKEMVKRITSREPTKLKPIACNVFAAELFVEDDDGKEIVCEPLEEIVELLDALDTEDDTDEGDDTDVVCGDEGDYNGETVVCTLPTHLTGEHSGTTSGGDAVTW